MGTFDVAVATSAWSRYFFRVTLARYLPCRHLHPPSRLGRALHKPHRPSQPRNSIYAYDHVCDTCGVSLSILWCMAGTNASHPSKSQLHRIIALESQISTQRTYSWRIDLDLHDGTNTFRQCIVLHCVYACAVCSQNTTPMVFRWISTILDFSVDHGLHWRRPVCTNPQGFRCLCLNSWIRASHAFFVNPIPGDADILVR